MFNFLNQRGLFYLISFVLSNFINSSFAEEYLWYAANATNNLYVTAEEACANYNMAQVGYPSCIYQSTELWITNDPSAGAKCLHKCGNAIQNKINAARKPMEYIVPITDDAPIPKQCSGNPIDTSRGSKIQIETDIIKNGSGHLSLERTYNNYENNNIWRHSYAKKIVIIEPKSDQRIEFKSLPYTSKPYTCTAGWNELKTKFSSSWNTGTNAQYINGKCLLIRNNSVVKILPIVRNISSTPFYTPDLIQLIRENGTTYQFHSTDNSSFFEMNGELGRLEY